MLLTNFTRIPIKSTPKVPQQSTRGVVLKTVPYYALKLGDTRKEKCSIDKRQIRFFEGKILYIYKFVTQFPGSLCEISAESALKRISLWGCQLKCSYAQRRW